MADDLGSLIDAARKGDDRAFEAFVVRTRPVIRALCSRLGSPGEEDDLIQEVYLRAVRAAPSYRGDAPPLPWLLTIARRTCADHVRRRQRDRRVIERVRSEPVQTATPSAEFTDDLLESIDPDRRDAFTATQLGGLSYEEAASALGCPVGTIRSRVARARADLRTVVERAAS